MVELEAGSGYHEDHKYIRGLTIKRDPPFGNFPNPMSGPSKLRAGAQAHDDAALIGSGGPTV